MSEHDDEEVVIGTPEDSLIGTMSRLIYEVTNARLHGYFASQPGSVVTNIEHIRSEIDDLMEALSEFENHLESMSASTHGGH